MALLSLWCLLWLIPEHTIPPTSDRDLSPALVPSIAVGACLLTAAIMAIRAWGASETDKAALDEEFGAEATGIDRRVLWNAFLVAAVSIVSWLLLEYVGFEPAMGLLIATTMWFMGVRRIWTIVLTSVLTPVVLSQATWFFFSTELPGFWH